MKICEVIVHECNHTRYLESEYRRNWILCWKRRHKTSSSSFKVYIPKILPTIKKGTAQVRTESISTNGIINDTKCKIDPSSSVKTRNYIEVPASDNVNFKRPVFKNGAKLRISYTAGNVDSGKIMNTIDSSTFDKKVSTV